MMTEKKANITQFLINLDLEKLIEVNLSIEQFIFLTLLDEKKSDIYLAYTSKFQHIITSKNQLEDLIKRGLLLMNIPDVYLFSNFKVTEKFHQLFFTDKAKIIQDLKDVYPKQTPSGIRKGLHADQAKWIPKYLSIVKNNLQLHELILNCIRYELEINQSNGQLEYLPMLSTYINKRRWETYEEDVKKHISKGELITDISNNNVEDI